MNSRPLEFVSTQDLTDELEARTDHGFFYLAVQNPKDETLFYKRFWGCRPYCAGLCLNLANMILENFNSDSSETPDHKIF